MSELARAVSAEFFKLRRTLALRLAVAAPLFIVLLQFGVYLGRGEEMGRGDPVAGFARGIVTLWTLIFLPFYATLAASLLASLDHHEHHWDQIFTLPVRRGSIYGAKWIAVAALVGLSSLALPVFGLGAAEILKLVRPEWAGLALPGGLLLNGVARSFPAALLLISLQFWFSLRYRSFVLALAIGIAGIMSGIIFITAPLKFLCLYPWTAPGAAACWRLARRDA
jgi:hypothetical protein